MPSYSGNEALNFLMDKLHRIIERSPEGREYLAELERQDIERVSVATKVEPADASSLPNRGITVGKDPGND